MKTSKKPKPPRSLQDAEVKTAAHDDLLMWLWRFLDEGYSKNFSLHPATLAELVGKAEKAAKDSLARRVQECRDAAVPEREDRFGAFYMGTEGKMLGRDKVLILTPPEICSALLKKADEIEAYIANFRAPAPLPEATILEVVRKTLQAEIREEGDYSVAYGGAPGKVIGYMDVVAQVQMTGALSLHCYERPTKQYRASPDDGESRTVKPGEVAHLTGIVLLKQPRWETQKKECSVWFDVRAEAQTTGETIRDMRWLDDLAGDDTLINLVLDRASPDLRATMEHEGFRLITRQQFDPK